MMVPFLLIIKPEPKEEAFLSVGLLKSLNISSKGDPGGNWKGSGLAFVLIVCVVEIFTTEGINLSARSAKESGIGFALEKLINPKLKNMKTVNIFLKNFI